MKPFLCIALVLALGTGCDSTTEPSEYTDAVFTLEDAVLPPGSGTTSITPSTITFAPDGAISVDSCNDCDGTYSWDGNLLRTSVGCTEAACGGQLDLGVWLEADRIVASDSEDGEVTLVAEQRDGEIATFLFSVSER